MTEHQRQMQHQHDDSSSSIDATSPSDRSMSAADIRSVYADYADWLHRFEWVDTLVTGRYRRDRFSDVDGRVLDVACGTGTNFQYLPDTVDLVGIDISPDMLGKARDTLAELDVNGTLQQMDAQELEFADDSFDAVISSLSTCTFPDPVTALQEMERVCKPEGTIRLVEHGRSDSRPVAWYQERRADAHYEKMGCRWTQEPRDVVAEAGLSVQDSDTGLFGILTTFEITPQEV